MLMPKRVKFRRHHRGRMKACPIVVTKFFMVIMGFRLWNLPGLAGRLKPHVLL